MVNEFSYLSTGYSTYGRELLTRLHNSGKYEVAEFATYVDHEDQRLRTIPWTVFCNAPVNQNSPNFSQDEVNEYNSNPVNAFGAWRFEDVCLAYKADAVVDVRDFWMCLTKTSNIVCYDGIKKISDIRLGDLALTHTGQYKKVTKLFKRKYDGNIVSIRTKNCPFKVNMTDNHPVLHIKKNNSPGYPEFNSGDLKWTDSKNLNVGDILVYPIDNEGVNNEEEDYCRLLGYYMAEGCLMYEGRKSKGILKGVQFAFHAKEVDFVSDVVRCIKKRYNRDTKVRIKNNTAIVRCFGRDVATDMRAKCGDLSGSKKLCNEIFFSNNNCVKSFLCGLFRGDGGFYKNRGNYCTKSEQLGHQVFRLCLRLGVLPSFNKNKNTIYEKEYYRYIFSFAEKNAFKGFSHIYDNKIPSVHSKRIKDGYAWFPIKEKKTRKRKCNVYNFEVEEDNSYVSSFAVHNCNFEAISPFRHCYKWVPMPTVDAACQNEQWLSTYCGADAVLTYQDWSGKVLEDEAGGKIDWRGSASPAAADCFIPMSHRSQLKESLGLGPDVNIVGTVMRNQRRKLYPELFSAFRKYLDQTGDTNTVLYCHTSYPDRGWDIPYHIMKNELSSKVFFTYVCGTCGHSYGCTFQDAKTRCTNCGGTETGLANVKRGVQPERLAEIYNMFDVYVQYASSEGLGIPQLEAAACGVPVMSVDYSAMSDVVRKLNGYPIPVKLLYCEMETGCSRAYPDEDAFVELLTNYLRMPTSMRAAKRMETRGHYVKNYSWDKCADKWMSVFDSLGYGNWDSPARIREPVQPNDQIQYMTNSEYAKWLIINVLCEPEKLNSYMFTRLVRDLNYEAYIEGIGGLYYNEQSFIFSQGQYEPFNREIAYNQMAHLCHRRNQWEQKRTQTRE